LDTLQEEVKIPQYISLFQQGSNEIWWVCNTKDNNPRIFEDQNLARACAKVFSPYIKIVTVEEFQKMIDGKQEVQ
jgi:hypothetical protein